MIFLLATLLFNCAQSITGKNVLNIKEEFGLDPLKVSRNKFIVKKIDLSVDKYVNLKLLEEFYRAKDLEENNDIQAEIDGLISSICTS